MTGQQAFARYAYPPNELGYCGPEDAHGLFAAGAGAGLSAVEVERRAKLFDGAWPYLEIIAEGTGLTPFDRRVVDAYWVGSALLDRVDADWFADTVRARFAGQVHNGWPALRPDAPARAVAHHSFHVFAVYPWVDLLGRGDHALRVLDRCRVRWGRVVGVTGDELEVRSRPLSWDGRALGYGPPRVETARWAVDGTALVPAAPGDWVALHWDWVCDRLTPTGVRWLRHFTNRHLALVNTRC